jgi:hypothetical protein
MPPAGADWQKHYMRTTFPVTVLLLFPNPAENRLNLTSPELEKCQQIQIINTLGQIQFQTRIHSTDQVSLSIDELVPGLYLIHLSCMDGIIMTQSFIKQ